MSADKVIRPRFARLAAIWDILIKSGTAWVEHDASTLGAALASWATGVTLLVSSHVMEEATRCQRLLLLREGRLLIDDTPDALLQRTGQSDMDAAFLHLVRLAVAA